MKYCRAAMLHYILLGAAANAVETEPGFPIVCGNPTVQREHKAEAQRMKTHATPHSWPWHVGLWTTRLGGRPFCGGTLISNFLVVTAAHCIFSSPGLHEFPLGKLTDIEAASGVRFHVLVGTHDYTREDTAYQLRLVHYAMVHPHYNDTILGKGYDIALLKLHENIIPDERVRPICFPSPRVSVRQGSACYYAGWGGFYPTWSKDTLVYPTTLREAEVQIDFDENCAKFFGPRLPDSKACIKTEGTNPCYGDSGGGIFCLSEDDKRWFWYGTIGGGIKGCRGSHAYISNFQTVHRWIKDTASILDL